MVNWISSWLQGIIVAVIIGTIIEMLLPKSSISKFIKVVIGLYILFSIITPVVNKFSKNKIDINEILNMDEYKSKDTIANVNQTNDEIILDVYEENVKLDLKNKLQIKGYIADYIIVNITSDNKYNIEKIEVKIKSKTDNKENEKTATTIVDNIESVKINLSKTEDKQEKSVITDSEKTTLQNYISTAYEISADKIIVK